MLKEQLHIMANRSFSAVHLNEQYVRIVAQNIQKHMFSMLTRC